MLEMTCTFDRRSSVVAALAATALVLSQHGVLAQSDTLAPTPNLVVEGLPPIPAALGSEVRRYTESRSATLADWHPTRRELLIATRFGNASQIHAVKTPGGARTQLTFAEEPITSARHQPTEAGYFVFERDTGGDEFRQLYRYDVHRGGIVRLTDGGRSQNGGVVWSRRGERMAYESTRRNGADRDLYVMNPADPSSDRIVMQAAGGGWSALDWSPDDSTLLVSEYVSVARSHLWLVDVASGQKTRLTPPEEQVAYDAGLFSADGRGVWVTTDKDSEFLRLAYLDLAGRNLTPLTADLPWDVDGLDLSHDGRTLAFTTNEAGVSKLYVMDTASRQRRPVTGIPAGVIASVRWHPNATELAFTVSSARSSSDVYSVVPATGQVTRWTESELGGLIAAELSEPELVRWRSFDGLEISGFYYRPPARFSGPRPVIVNIHGGPEGQSRPTYLGRSNYFLNELGVAVIYPNVRGSTGYGKTFLALDNGTKREDSVRDVGALLDWIATRPELDARRVMVTGGSYGGYMTLAVATMFDDRIRCSVDIVGISNFSTFLKNTESYRRDLRRAEYGDERDPAMHAFFERIAPLNNASKITKPLFVVQGGNDPRVPRSESEQMVARVRQNGSPVWYLMATDEGHGFAKKGNVDFQFYATVMFVQRFLLAA
jgi:dipeptidyl aminopeptidase/acylaminoacyl peptidase